MKTEFQLKNYSLEERIGEYFQKKIDKLDKFLPHDAFVLVGVEKNQGIQSGPNLFRVTMNIQSSLGNFFSEEKSPSPQVSFDKTYKEIVKMIKDKKGKSQNLLRRAGDNIKNFFIQK
ncbi:MAG: HPF/RaiA family ribosome-associated protein [Candidatus Pacebacteria bacterium]|nr:HPF/RaiA family ribosome-associated protein [Candidatus Paceibacterota bacterium]